MTKRKREDDFIDDVDDEFETYFNDDSYTSEGEGDSATSGSDGSGSEQSYDSSSEEEEPDPALIQAGRRIQIGDVHAIDNIGYLPGGAPAYTPAARPGAGGQSSVAILGPGGYWSRNSDADRKAIPAIVPAEAAYPQHGFKAGHLLNAEFGGSGSDANNLTILSSAANSAMRAFDNAIKAAVTTTLKHAYTCANNAGIDVTTLTYGIQLTITTTGGFWSNHAGHPGYLLANNVTCVAAIVGEPAIPALEAVLAGQYGTDRVNNHAQLMVRLAADIATLRNQVAAANAVGNVANP